MPPRHRGPARAEGEVSADEEARMSRVGILQLLVLLLGLGVIGLGIVMTWKGKLRIFAAGLGVFQGLFGIALAARGAPPSDRLAPLGYPAQLETAVLVALLILQGVTMLAFAVATYKGRLWGAYGLCVVVILVNVMWLLLARTFTGFVVLLVYAGAAESIRRARARAREQSPPPD